MRRSAGSEAMSPSTIGKSSCEELLHRRQELGIDNICLLLELMICLSPSNYHNERHFAAMDGVKTTYRCSLSQQHLNNLLRIRLHSLPANKFKVEDVLQHWNHLCFDRETGKAMKVLGTQIPNIQNLRAEYPEDRKQSADLVDNYSQN